MTLDGRLQRWPVRSGRFVALSRDGRLMWQLCIRFGVDGGEGVRREGAKGEEFIVASFACSFAC